MSGDYEQHKAALLLDQRMPRAEWMLLHALEYGNEADDVTMLMSASGVAKQTDWSSDALRTVGRCGRRCVPNVVAAFICWASGGASAIRGYE